MASSVLPLKWITARSHFAKYDENIKIPKVCFVMQTYLVLTGQHFTWEVAPSSEAFSFSNIKIKPSEE